MGAGVYFCIVRSQRELDTDDRKGKTILPPIFVQPGNFSNGLAWVNLSEVYILHGDTDKWGYINKAGKFVWTSLN